VIARVGDDGPGQDGTPCILHEHEAPPSTIPPPQARAHSLLEHATLSKQYSNGIPSRNSLTFNCVRAIALRKVSRQCFCLPSTLPNKPSRLCLSQIITHELIPNDKLDVSFPSPTNGNAAHHRHGSRCEFERHRVEHCAFSYYDGRVLVLRFHKMMVRAFMVNCIFCCLVRSLFVITFLLVPPFHPLVKMIETEIFPGQCAGRLRVHGHRWIMDSAKFGTGSRPPCTDAGRRCNRARWSSPGEDAPVGRLAGTAPPGQATVSSMPCRAERGPATDVRIQRFERKGPRSSKDALSFRPVV
jgi:hypothetical protein